MNPGVEYLKKERIKRNKLGYVRSTTIPALQIHSKSLQWIILSSYLKKYTHIKSGGLK